jgi:hypothetical protein
LAIDEQQHVALPKLYGGPAYARPPRPVDETPRPLDPDDLPIAAFQTDEERRLAESLPARTYVGTRDAGNGHGGKHAGQLNPRPFRLRALAGRLLRGS